MDAMVKRSVLYILLTMILVVCGTILIVMTYNKMSQQNRVHPISENERQAISVGIVMGLDVARALKGYPAMDAKTFDELNAGFLEHTKGCLDMMCVMDRIVVLRQSIQEKMQTPTEPEVFR